MSIFKSNLPKFVLVLLTTALPIAIYAQPYAYVSNISGNNISVVNTANNTVTAMIRVDASPSGLAVSPDGSTVYVACFGANTVNAISTASNSVIASIPVGPSPIQVGITPSGNQVYVVAQAANQINVIDTGSKSVIANINNVGSHPNHVAFSLDGTRAYVAGVYSGNVSIIDTASKSVVGTFPTGSGPSDIAVSANGRLYVGNQYSNTVTVHDTSGSLLATIPGFTFPNSLAATPNGARVFVTNGNGSSVSTIDTSSNTIMGTLPTGSVPTSVTVSADGANAYVVNEQSFSLTQVNVGGNYVANTLPRVGVYPIAVATQPPAAVAPPCTYSLSASSVSLTAAGGSGSVNVSVAAGCPWTAVSNTGWAQVTGGSSGTGNGTVSYSVNPNAGVSSVSGTMTIAGQMFTINEAGAAPPSGGSASFVKVDTTSSGTWKGVYGADGFNVVNDTVSYPAYVTVTPSGNSSYTFVGSTADIRGMQKAASTTDRMAACWYTFGSESIDLHFNDSSTHQVALYLLDWDGYAGGRSERVDILDANNTVLDSRTVSGFGNGQYLVWNMSGHVTVRITNLNGSSNAVLSGILFGAGGAVNPPPSGGTAAFVKTDITTAGTWKGVYGADGYNVVNDTVNYPAYVTVTPSGNASYTFVASTADIRGMQKAASTTDRLAACWYSFGSQSIDLQFKDSSTHQVALYLLDWDGYAGGRSERVDVLDANNTLLDSRTVSGFGNGQYLVWNLSGHVIVRITNLNASSNAVLSGILFGAGSVVNPPPSGGTASFVKTDTTTAGSWKGVYGADGYNTVNDTVNYPAYVTVTPSGNSSYTFVASTADIRAMQKAASTTDRMAACWYSFGSESMDLQFNDSSTHQVALYLLDWDGYAGGRSERVDILDANNTLLDSRTVSGFGNGQYLVWNMSGHVTVRITNLNASSNAVVSGILFR